MPTENGTQTDFAGEAWDNFRQEGFADVKAAAGHALEKAKVYLSRIDDFEEEAIIRQLKSKAHVMKRRHAGLELLLGHMMAHGPTGVPRWEELSAEEKEGVGTKSKYLDEMHEVLENNPPGTFGDKTSLYRKVSKRLGNKEGACRQHMNRYMEDEPEDESAWRDYLL
jgi:hypothetical protein